LKAGSGLKIRLTEPADVVRCLGTRRDALGAAQGGKPLTIGDLARSFL
jgi:hypothetical protein